jgi:succinate dehydrogenase hydrophobic anchor subunit
VARRRAALSPAAALGLAALGAVLFFALGWALDLALYATAPSYDAYRVQVVEGWVAAAFVALLAVQVLLHAGVAHGP